MSDSQNSDDSTIDKIHDAVDGDNEAAQELLDELADESDESEDSDDSDES